jgi:hypothetical protein
MAYHVAMVASRKAYALPSFVVPMAAQPVANLPEGDDWLYELKLDGSPYSAAVSAARYEERSSAFEAGRQAEARSERSGLPTI